MAKKRPNIRKVLKRVHEAAQEEGRAILWNRAMEGRNMVFDGITQQTFAFPPLSAQRKKEKAEKGLYPQALMSTAHFVNNIDVVETDDPDVLFVGVPDGVMAVNDQGEETDTPLQLLDAMHEKGTSRMPARPHYAPVVRRLKQKYKA